MFTLPGHLRLLWLPFWLLSCGMMAAAAFLVVVHADIVLQGLPAQPGARFVIGGCFSGLSLLALIFPLLPPPGGRRKTDRGMKPAGFAGRTFTGPLAAGNPSGGRPARVARRSSVNDG